MEYLSNSYENILNSDRMIIQNTKGLAGSTLYFTPRLGLI
jgi:hypothetical protein